MARKEDTITVQSTYTRSTYHWMQYISPEGRIGFIANGKGVPALMGRIAITLLQSPNISKAELLTDLREATGNDTLNMGDLSQPFRQMHKAGMLQSSGLGNATTYRLTARGKSMLNKEGKLNKKHLVWQ
jgi:hypothetical protein